MSNEKSGSDLDEVFSKIKIGLPPDWLAMSEDLRLHHLLVSVNEVLRPQGSWVLINGDMTLIDLIGERSMKNINDKNQC